MHIVTSATANYFGAVRPYLDSLKAHGVLFTVVCIDSLMPNYPAVTLTGEQNAGAPEDTQCAQHGSWLKVIEGAGPFVYTDGDIILQRDFTATEKDAIENIPDNVIGVSYNSGPGETLRDEGARLRPTADMAYMASVFGADWQNIPNYNIGVMVARRSTFQRIYDAYMPLWMSVGKAFRHYARQQWLVSYVIHRLEIAARVMPYSFHANGHYGMPPGCYYENGAVYSGNALVAFRHKL